MTKTGIKTKDLRPCDNCGQPIAPIFYRFKVQLRQLMIDSTAVNEVLGTSQILGGNLMLGSMMSPNRDVAIELGNYEIDKDIFLCTDCACSPEFSISPIALMIEHDEEEE